MLPLFYRYFLESFDNFLDIKNGIDEFKVSNIFLIMPKRALGRVRIDD